MNQKADQPLLQVSQLHTYFGLPRSSWMPFTERPVLRAVNGVSFDIRAGEVLALVGESGCGKSTIGRTLTQLEAATGGAAVFQGEDILRLDRAQFKPFRRVIQMVFQDPFASLNPRMTIGEVLTEPLLVHGLGANAEERQEKVAAILQQVGLDPKVASKYPHEFSGGQRQRIGIARVMILEPDLVIADEPVSALDVSVQAQVLNLLAELQQKTGFAMLFISHDMGVVRHIADRVAVMYLGKIVELGDTETLFTQPNHPYTRLLLHSIPRVHNHRTLVTEVIQAEPLSPMQVHPGCSFENRCPQRVAMCTSQPPKLVPLDTSHHSRCHLAQQFAQEVH